MPSAAAQAEAEANEEKMARLRKEAADLADLSGRSLDEVIATLDKRKAFRRWPVVASRLCHGLPTTAGRASTFAATEGNLTFSSPTPA